MATLVMLVLTLLLLAWFSRQLSLYIQMVFFALTRNGDQTIVFLFLLLLPGVIIHEAAHWGAARLLGLKTGKFRVWPKKQGKQIGMGSVSVQRGSLWQDSIVGLAPLVLGSVLIAWIGQQIFAAEQLSAALGAQQWAESLWIFRSAFKQPDGVVWAYLLFAIGNAMMPSASDREPLLPLIFYSLLALILYVILGLPLTPFTALLTWLTPLLQSLSSAFIFTILLDGVILFVLYCLVLLMAPRAVAK
ncbi:MAG: hypothetical protein R3C14_04395 [Caldilineaceae bacterium]